jgi:hypothetical protein
MEKSEQGLVADFEPVVVVELIFVSGFFLVGEFGCRV